MSIISKLKNRWGIESTLQVVIILVVFTCTGFSTLYVRKFVFQLLGVTPDFPFWQQALIWLCTIFPIYNLLLIMYGTLFGQKKFFVSFLKKLIGRFRGGVSKKEQATES